MRRRYPAFLLSVLWLAAGCAPRTLQDEAASSAPSLASRPAQVGALSELATRITDRHGVETSGVKLLDDSYRALMWRLALIDSAVSSLDIQTYLWYPDASGSLVLERVLRAAQRGVRIRLLIDDLMTAGQDQLMADLESQPNVEIRLFNPWSRRRLGARAAQAIGDMERLNTRMHNKLMIVDGHATILGGRNIGDHYFGLNQEYNFRDLDVLAFGRLAAESADVFDAFWNSEWAVSAAGLSTLPNPETAQQAWLELTEKIGSAQELSAFPRVPRDWTSVLGSLFEQLRFGTTELVYDSVGTEHVGQTMLSVMAFLFERARQELLVTNAYIVPSERGIDFLHNITRNGVDVRILTNSLESHDVPAVNSHYHRWRDDLLLAGAELYELRADAAVQSNVDVTPVEAEFVGLHTKAAVIDREQVFIGSMNLDPAPRTSTRRWASSSTVRLSLGTLPSSCFGTWLVRIPGAFYSTIGESYYGSTANARSRDSPHAALGSGYRTLCSSWFRRASCSATSSGDHLSAQPSSSLSSNADSSRLRPNLYVPAPLPTERERNLDQP